LQPQPHWIDEPAGTVQSHVHLPPLSPLDVRHSLLRSQLQLLAFSPELTTVPTQAFEQAAAPAGQLALLLSEQMLESMYVVMVSSRHSLGSTHIVSDPVPGGMAGIEIPSQAFLPT